ncbi:MAG: glycosyltransferase family 4 protein [Pirellulaceae bacterium]|jgi:glycosyltransferase involved in cell wall biosynthesis|nr:glycosyltransferase family 4 protein [Pirellulaceae bacterium]MDP6556538.1 glycosyltransferase family 4 protein [Pirellulaceae bacterium]
MKNQRLNILLCHNHYQHPGGEDSTFADESMLLESHGHNVIRYTMHNDDICDMRRTKLAVKTMWNRQTYYEVRALVREHRPAVMHCTNTFPLISPSVYYAAKDESVPVVQSLHNYRMFCANSLFLRDGRACEDCLGKRIPWPAMVHGCYRESRLATAAVISMVAIHRFMRTWIDAIQLYCTPTEFARQKFIQGGIASEKIVVKPNFVGEDRGVGEGRGNYVVFAGRLSREKGIETLLQVWRQLTDCITLKIVGDGPISDVVARAASHDSRIQWMGQRSCQEVAAIIGEAKCVLLPSICYETFGRTVIEAYCKGTPVIVSDGGAIAELVRENETGYLFESGNADQLLAKLNVLLANTAPQRMRQAARRAYELKYTAEENYRQLLDLYSRASNKVQHATVAPIVAGDPVIDPQVSS